jgi:hypothetical protein
MSTKDAQHARISVVLQSAEIERVRRFGEVRSFDAGESLFKVGEVGSPPLRDPGGQRRASQTPRIGPLHCPYAEMWDVRARIMP